MKTEEDSMQTILRLLPCIAVILLLATIGCSKEGQDAMKPPPEKDRGSQHPISPMLVDVTSESGIDFVHDPGMRGDYLFPEITGSGCGFIDYDNDGWLDIYWVQSGRALDGPRTAARTNKLYRNLRDGTFEDVTVASGAGDDGYGQGVAVGDYDNDGFVDMYVSNLGDDALLRNRGDGTFLNVTRQAGIDNPAWSIAAGFLDYDQDGDLDLYVSNYVLWSPEIDRDCTYYGTSQEDYCGPKSYEPAPDAFYRNNGDGTFTNVSDAVGLTEAFGPAMSVICADFDDDGFVDVYVGNDSAPNQLWQNQQGQRFRNVAWEWGTAVNGLGQAEGSMGCNAEDFNDDGILDLFMCHFYEETHTLYVSRGARFYEDITVRTGLGRLSMNRTGFGACTLNLLNDPTLCIIIGNGGVRNPTGPGPDPQNPKAEYDQLITWDGKVQKFSDISDKAGSALQHLSVTRGVAVGDYDNDGDPDILMSPNNGRGRLLRNEAGNGHNWLQVHCRGPNGMRDALGAKVLATYGGRTCRRDVIVNSSYGSSCDHRLHFGLGENTVVDRLLVKWLDGTESLMENVPANQVVTFEQNSRE